MKNYYILSALFLSLWSFGQNTTNINPEGTWTFGTKFGLNIASVNGDYLDLDYVKDAKSFIGFHGGGWVNYQLSPSTSLQAELLGSLQGGDLTYELEYNGILGRSEVEMRLPYILIPVMFKYEPIENGYVEIGPQANILIKEDFAYKAFLNDVPVDDDQAEALIENRLKDSRRFDVGLNIGAGYEFYNHWSVYTRYTLGLVTVDDREEDQRDLKNRVFAFGVSYGF